LCVATVCCSVKLQVCKCIEQQLGLQTMQTRGERIIPAPVELRASFLDGGWSNTSRELLLLQQLGKKSAIFAVGFPAFVLCDVAGVFVATHFGSWLIVFMSCCREQACKPSMWQLFSLQRTTPQQHPAKEGRRNSIGSSSLAPLPKQQLLAHQPL